MKRIYTILSAIIITASVFLPQQINAQAPEKMSYQAVIRNLSNQLVTNQSVGMQISILQTTASGMAVYTEIQTSTTNANGLVTIEIGTGTTNDDFATIDWANDVFFIKTETDPTGGTNYTITGISQLLSVPYALHAKTAETLTGTINESDPVFAAWDKNSGISITESQITDLQEYLTSEVDPAFAAWNKTTGITISESQISDLTHTVDTNTHIDSTDIAGLGYIAGGITTESDPTFTSWNKTTGISITESQISDLTHTVDTDTQLDSTDMANLGYVAGAITSETDPIFINSQANNITEQNITDLANLSGINSGDQDLSNLATKAVMNDTASVLRANLLATKAYVDTLEAKLNILISKVDLNSAIPISDLLTAGVSVSDLLKAGASVSDLLAAEVSIPNLLAAGASVSDLLAASVSVSDLITADASLSDLLLAGFSVPDLLTAGASVSNLLAAEVSVTTLLTAGIGVSDFMGIHYKGGIIFYVDTTNGTGLVCAVSDLIDSYGTISDWYKRINTVGDGIGAGVHNTELMIANYGYNNAAGICVNYQGGGYNDWYLPCKYELNLLYLQKNAVGDIINNYHWSSNECSSSRAWIQNFDNGEQKDYDKYDSAYVRAIRAF